MAIGTGRKAGKERRHTVREKETGMAKKAKEPTFEEALEELEQITRSLESGSLSLDESIQAYEKGMELRKICVQMLEKAEKKLEYLEKQNDGQMEAKPISEESVEEEDADSLPF